MTGLQGHHTLPCSDVISTYRPLENVEATWVREHSLDERARRAADSRLHKLVRIALTILVLVSNQRNVINVLGAVHGF
jgi:hypothetical protein